MEYARHKILFFLNILLPFFLQAQSLSGRVFDKESGIALGNCNISITGSNRGTISNEDGFYSLELSEGRHTILFQYIGYRSDTLKVVIQKQSVLGDIGLKKQLLSTEDIVVFASPYSQAEQIILRAAQEKKEYLKKLQNYSCKSYTKSTVFRTLHSNAAKYGLLIEFYSKIFWNTPDYYYEIIESQKQSSNLPQSVNIFSGNAFLNINADRISLGQKTIIGPTAPDAIEFYQYEIMDTLFQDEERIFKMRITPKENFRPLMSGILYLVDKKFIIQKIDVHLNTPCNYGFFQNIHIVQRYTMDRDKMYLPYHSLNEGDWVIDIPKYPKLKYRKENFREEFCVNNPLNRKYSGETKIVYENKIPFSAVPMNIPPLTVSERNGYSQIDSIVKHRPLVSFMAKSAKLIDAYSYLKKQPVGTFSDFYRFNKAEGNYVGLAFNSKRLLQPFNLYCAWGKGLSDKKYKYSLDLSYNFNPDINLIVRKFDTITIREGKTELPLWFNTFSSLFSGFDYFDYYYTKGQTFSLNITILPFRFYTTFFSEKHQKAINRRSRGWWGKSRFIPAIEINEGLYNGIRFVANYSTAGYRQTPLSKELLQNKPYTEIYWRYEKGLKKWGSMSEYNRQELIFYFRKNTFYNGSLDLQLNVSIGSENLPLQKYFELESGFSGYGRFKTFRTLDLNTFAGNKKMAVYGEYNFHNTFFQLSRLPYIQDIPLDLIFIYNWGWAGRRQWNNIRLTDFYSETGFGIGRLFSLLKLEFLWGLKNKQIGRKFVFSVKISEIEL